MQKRNSSVIQGIDPSKLTSEMRYLQQHSCWREAARHWMPLKILISYSRLCEIISMRRAYVSSY